MAPLFPAVVSLDARHSCSSFSSLVRSQRSLVPPPPLLLDASGRPQPSSSAPTGDSGCSPESSASSLPASEAAASPAAATFPRPSIFAAAPARLCSAPLLLYHGLPPSAPVLELVRLPKPPPFTPPCGSPRGTSPRSRFSSPALRQGRRWPLRPSPPCCRCSPAAPLLHVGALSIVVPIAPSAPHTWPQPRAVVTVPTRTGAILDRQVPFGFIKTFMYNYTR